MTEIMDQVQQLQTFTKDLDAVQLNFKPTADSWSILEIGEHLCIVEAGVISLLAREDGEKASEKQHLSTTALKQLGLNRQEKVKAPERMIPTGKFQSADALLNAFATTRATLDESLKNKAFNLEQESFPHPRLGPMTKLDWLNFIVFHCQRHLSQMEENIALYQKQV